MINIVTIHTSSFNWICCALH